MPAGGSSGAGCGPLPLVLAASAAVSLFVLIQPMTPFSRPHTPNTQPVRVAGSDPVCQKTTRSATVYATRKNRFQNQDPVHGAHFLFRRLPFLPQRPQTLPQVLIRQPGHEITQEGTGSPRRRGHNEYFHGLPPLQKIVFFHAHAVNVQDPLRGHSGFVVLEILVILAIDFVGVNIGQDLLKMFLTVPGAVFYFVPEP